MEQTGVAAIKKPAAFSAPATEWWPAVGYCLMLSLTGLKFFPVLLGIVIFLTWRWRTDRYAFLVELLLIMGDYGFKRNDVLPMKLSDVALIIGVVGIIIYRKNIYVSRVSKAMLAYFAVLILIASTSVESMNVQFVMMRNYLIIIAFFIPLLTFANRNFSWEKMERTIVVHALVICAFYVIDTFLLGFILLPGTTPWGEPSTFYNPRFEILGLGRHYPYGLYWLVLCIPAITSKRIRFSVGQWILIVLALYASRTNSLLFALVVCFVFFRPNIKQVGKYLVIGVFAIVAAYFVDSHTGRNLRLADNIDQFTSLSAAQDNIDLAEFGTGRMAQIIPKWLLLDEMDRLDVGFGFLHPTLTTNPIFQIRNDFYSDVSQADELATAVEVTQVQTILDCGYLGLLAQFAFYIGTYFLIRKLKHAKYYLCAFVGMSVLGIGGFAGVTQRDGLLIIALALGMVFLANKKKLNDTQNNPLLLAER